MNITNIFFRSRALLAFASGALIAAVLQINPIKASSTQPSGRCVEMTNSNTWGVPAQPGESVEYGGIGIMDFDNRTGGAYIAHRATAAQIGRPTYSAGTVETPKAAFDITAGPLEGTFKLSFGGSDNDYMIVAPVNGGATYFVVDPTIGATGVCQRV